eukprot:6492574-Amphidinium_carterae.2
MACANGACPRLLYYLLCRRLPLVSLSAASIDSVLDWAGHTMSDCNLLGLAYALVRTGHHLFLWYPLPPHFVPCHILSLATPMVRALAISMAMMCSVH